MAQRDDRDSGFINLRFNRDDKTWTIGGTWTDERSNKWDLGYAKTGTRGLAAAIALIAGQIEPTLAGKGIEKQERQDDGNRGNRGKQGNRDRDEGGGY